MSSQAIKILVADDHSIIRLGIKMLLKKNFNCEIKEASNGDEVYDVVKSFSPDLVILDINMPGTHTQGILQIILTLQPQLKVIIFSVNKEEIYGRLFIQLGAKGYLEKDTDAEEIIKAINRVLEGNIYIRNGMEGVYFGNNHANNINNPYAVLTKKEMEILRYLSKGDSVSSISKILNLSPSTVGTHKANILEKLKMKNVIELSQFTTINPLN